MNLHFDSLSRVDTAMAWAMLADAAVKSLLVLTAAWVATRALRRASAAMRHLIWTLAVCGTLALPVLSATLPQWRILPMWLSPNLATSTAVAPAMPILTTNDSEPRFAAIPVSRTVNPRVVTLPARSTEEASTPLTVTDVPIETALPAVPIGLHDDAIASSGAEIVQTTTPPMPTWWSQLSWQSWALLVWMCGFALMALPIAVSLLGLWRLGRKSACFAGASWTLLLHELAGQLKLRRPVLLVRGCQQAMPMTWGLVKTKLLLPPEADGWSMDRRRAVLMHELAHIKRVDFLTQLIVCVARAIYWFNPLFWVASKQIAMESEGACDDMVLSRQTKASDYAEHLLTVATGMKEGPLFSAAAVAMARPSRLEGRLLAILDAGRNRRRLTGARAALVGLLLTAVILPVAALRAGKELADKSAKAEATTHQWTTSEAVDSHQWIINGKPGERGSQVASSKQVSLVVQQTTDSIEYRYWIGPAADQGGAETSGKLDRITKGLLRLTIPPSGPLAVDGPTSVLRVEEWDDKGLTPVSTRELWVMKAVSAVAPLGHTAADREVLKAELQQAKDVAILQEQAYKTGTISVAELQAAKDKVEELEAELTGNHRHVAEVKLVAARRRLELASNLFKTGTMTALEYEKAKGAVAVAEAKVRQMQAQGQEMSTPTFGSILVRTVEEPIAPTWHWFDLDTGKSVSPANAFLGRKDDDIEEEEYRKWRIKNGVDVAAFSHDSQRGLASFDPGFVAYPVNDDQWERMTPRELDGVLSVSRADDRARAMTSGDKLPSTYVFQTREGGRGILQITGFIDKPRAVKIRYKLVQQVSAMAPRTDSTPTKKAAERAAKLKANIKTFTFALNYSGEQDKPYYWLHLSVPALKVQARSDHPFHPRIQITEDQAVKIIEHLATDGFLDQAFDVHDWQFIPAASQPGYSLTVADYYSDFGWKLPMLKRLDGLKTVLEGDAAKNMDLLLGRLSGLRKEWTPEEPVAADQNTIEAARERFLQVERVARLPEGKQAEELPKLYRDLAPRLMSPMIEGLLSSYPNDILNPEAKFATPGGDQHTERWANQIAAAATTLTPEQVADKLKIQLYINIAARARFIQTMQRNLETLKPLLRNDLDSSDPERVARAASVISTLRIDAFVDSLLAIYLRNDDCSKAVYGQMLFSPSPFYTDPRVAKALMADIAKNPASVVRHGGILAGIFQGKPVDPLIVKLLDDSAPETRRAAAWVLAECKDDSLAPYVAKLVKDADSQTRVAATWIAERLSEEAFRPVSASVRTLLESPDMEVRLRVCKCLAVHRDMSVANTLLQFLGRNKVEPGEAVTIIQAVQALAGSTFGYDIHGWGPAKKGNQDAIRKFDEWIRMQRTKAMLPAADEEAVAWSKWLKVNDWSWLEKDAPPATKPWEKLLADAQSATRPDSEASQLEYLRQLQCALATKHPRAGDLLIRLAIGDALVTNFSHKMNEEAIPWYAQILDEFKDLPASNEVMVAKLRLADQLHIRSDREAHRSLFIRLYCDVIETPEASIVVMDDNKFLTLDQARVAKYPAAERQRMADRGTPPDNLDQLDADYGPRLVTNGIERLAVLRKAAADMLARAQYVVGNLPHSRANLLRLQTYRPNDKIVQEAAAAFLRDVENEEAVRRSVSADLVKERLRLEREIAAASNTYGEKHPTVQALRDRIAKIAAQEASLHKNGD